jgi:Tol biopolymer transport system component
MYLTSTTDSEYDLTFLPLTDGGQPEVWLETAFNEDFGSFSPDGQWVAYKSDDTGKDQVFVARFPEGDRKIQVSLAGGSRPLWSRDGRELYFRDGPRVMAVDVTLGDRFTAGQPREISVVLNWFQELEELVPTDWVRPGYTLTDWYG